jgi:hypothetical protein
MNNIEKKMILKLARREISKEDFLKEYPVDLIQYPLYFRDVLKTALLKKNPDDIEYTLIAAFYIGSLYQYTSISRKLLLEDWHNQHENLVDILSSIVDEKNAKYFYQVLNSKYEYITNVEDFLVPVWVKCIWALGKIGTKEAKDYLEKFIDSPYEKIRKAVNVQFDRNDWKN